MKKLLVLDSNSIINRAFYGVRTLNAPDGTPTNAVYGFLNILIKLINDHKPEYILAAFDLKAPTFRHKLYDEYKANRKGMPDELAVQVPLMKDILADMNIPILQLEGYEADDIIGTVSRICSENKTECFIATGDRDDLQLAGNGTTVILASTKSGQSFTELFGADEVFEKYGVTPDEFVDLKALMGDTSDNIPGVKGIGEKTAAKLISQYKSIDGLYADINSIDATDRIKKLLLEGKDFAYLSKQLAKIDRHVPIEIDFDIARFDVSAPEFSPELYNLLSQLGLKSIIKKLDLSPCTSSSASAHTDMEFFDGKECIPVSNAKEFTDAIRSLGSEISLWLRCENETLCSAAFSNGRKAYFSAAGLFGDELLGAVSDILSDGEIKKYVFDIKKDMTALHDKVQINAVAFDCAIAASLCDPSKSNDIDSVSAEYLGISFHSEESSQLSLFDEFNEHSDSDGKYALAIYALHEKLAEIINKNGQHELYYNIELPLIKVLSSMEAIGFTLDTDQLRRFGNMLTVRIDDLENTIYESAGEKFNINSPKQLGAILFDKLNLKGGKKTKSGYSTKADILEKLAPDNKIIRDVLEYRKYQKLKSTYCDSLVSLVNPKTNRIHSVFHQTGTVTGRLSSSDPNLQNIPTRTELGREIRRMFTAKEGCILIDADYSQIELRVLAHLSNDETMIEAFKNGDDIHAVTASKILGIPIEQLTKEQRASAKAINFGIIYGMGEYTLSQDLNISFKQAKEYMEEYFDKYSGIRKYLDNLKKSAQENGYVKTMMNRIRYIPEINSSRPQLRAYGERIAMNTPVQGTAADIIKRAMVRVYDRIERENLRSRLILQVHDELIVESPFDEEERARDILKTEMENAVKLNVPLSVDMHSGKSWYDAK